MRAITHLSLSTINNPYIGYTMLGNSRSFFLIPSRDGFYRSDLKVEMRLLRHA